MESRWKYYDYCHEKYLPVSSCRNKFSPEALLFHSFVECVSGKALASCVRDVRKAAGRWKTVWGVKHENGSLSWELYFYNHGLRSPRNTVAGLFAKAGFRFKPSGPLTRLVDNFPYFMFSLDLDGDTAGKRDVPGVHVYTEGRPGVRQGDSYYLSREGIVLENHYDFYRLPLDMGLLARRLRGSVLCCLDQGGILTGPLVRRLMACGTVCIANKRNAQGMYFSRVNIDQLLLFLEFFSYPGYLTDYVRTFRKKLDHMLYDVAFDGVFTPKGAVFGKSSFYGVV